MHDLSWHHLSWHHLSWHHLSWHHLSWHHLSWHRLSWLLLLSATTLGGPASAADVQTEEALDTEVKVRVHLRYLLFLPSSYDKEEKKDTKWPMLVFLHGAGERGDDLKKVKTHGPPKLVESDPDFPFIVVSPQCPRGKWWNAASIAALVESVASSHRVDRERIYLTGLSMGGFGTWDTATKHPDLFAAIAPICGGGEPFSTRRIPHVPTWVFHGAKDSVVPIRRSQEMVDALKRAGGDVRFTVYPEAEHDSWTKTYANPELYEWFLRHRRQKARTR